MAGLNGDWYEALKGEFSKPYYKGIQDTSDLSAGGGHFQCLPPNAAERR